MCELLIEYVHIMAKLMEASFHSNANVDGVGNKAFEWITALESRAHDVNFNAAYFLKEYGSKECQKFLETFLVLVVISAYLGHLDHSMSFLRVLNTLI